MKIYLLDVNVLLALSWPHYLAALAGVRGGHLATLDRSLVARHPDVAVLVG